MRISEASRLTEHAVALAMQGECAVAGGRFQEGKPLLAQALSLSPDLIAAGMMHGMNLLRLAATRRHGMPGRFASTSRL